MGDNMKVKIINDKVFTANNIIAVRKMILKLFVMQNKWYRKPLINKCVDEFGLTSTEINDKSYNSLFTKCKSLVGSVINEMIDDGYLTLTEGKELVLLKDIKVILKEEDVTSYIGELLKKESLSQNNIINKCIKYYKTDKTKTKDDDNELINIIDNVLKSSIKNNVLKLDNNLYCFVSSKTALDYKIQSVINESKTGKLVESLSKAISIKGGEFFEALSVKVLTEYFKYCKNQITVSKVTGGSEDNGIDGIIEFNDDLNKRTKILIQAKVRTSCQVTLKEVREFYGAYKSIGATFGIFTTNSTFHNEAIKFASNLNDLVLVDKHMLLKLSKLTESIVIKTEDSYMLNENIFLNENFN